MKGIYRRFNDEKVVFRFSISLWIFNLFFFLQYDACEINMFIPRSIRDKSGEIIVIHC